MRVLNTFATLAIVANSSYAFDWTELKHDLAAGDYSSAFHDVFGDFKVTTRHDVNRKLAEQNRSFKPLKNAHRHAYNEAHHSLMARRERLGLPRVGQVAYGGPNVQQDFRSLNSFSGMFLNLIDGFQYNSGTQEGKCYGAMESLVIALDTSSDLLKKVYIPAYLAEIQVNVQDTSIILAASYVDCDLDKLFNAVSHLVSTEGVTELVSRLAAAYFFEISDCIEKWQSEPGQFSA